MSGIRTLRSPLIVLSLIALAHAATSFTLALSRLYEFKNSAFDLGAFLQVLNAIVTRGETLATLAPPYAEQHWLGFHFSPILYALAPLFALFPHPETLVAVQSLALAGAAIPVYAAARALHIGERGALLVGAAYLLHPYLTNAMVWDFHEASLGVLWMSCGLWAVAARRWRMLVVFCILLLLTKEHYGLSVAGFGMLWAMKHNRREGVFLALFGLAAMVLVMGVVMPHFRGGAANVMLASGSDSDRYSWLFTPARWPEVLPGLQLEVAVLALSLLAFFLFIPLFALAWCLPGVADAMIVALSEPGFFRSLYSYHCAALIPVLAVASAAGFPAFAARCKLRIGGLIVGVMLLGAYVLSPLPLPFARNIWELSTPRWALKEEDRKAIAEIAARVPEEAAFAAQSNIGTFFYPRRQLYVFPMTAEADYVALRLDFPFWKSPVVMGAPYSVPARVYREYAVQLLANKQRGIVYWQYPWLLLQRGAPDISKQARYDVLRAMIGLATAQEALGG